MNNVAKEGLEEALSRQLRSTRERLGAMLGRQGEALSPWVLRRTLRELQNVADPAVSDVEGGRRAAGVAGWYARATPEQRRDCWLLMSDQFPPDPSAIETARAAYDAARGTDEEARAEVQLRKAFASPRTRLLQRFAAFPEGVRFLVDLRAELLPHLKHEKRLLALDAELEDLFSTWFDVGFLELQRISWHSPAALVEKLIKYEAVLQAMPPRARQALARELGQPELEASALLKALDGVSELGEKSALRRWLLAAAARYLGSELTPDGRPLDAVARFHLGNGARVERLNWLADPSAKGLKQSYGLMVNYLYDLKRLDRHRVQLAQGQIPVSSAVQSLQD